MHKQDNKQFLPTLKGEVSLRGCDDDVDMLVQDKHTALSTCAWNEEYLHVHMQDDYDVLGMLLSKEDAELLKDTLDVFLEGGYADE